MTNREELLAGTNPRVADTDGDGLNDYLEYVVYGTSPTSADTDGDTLPDGLEVSMGLSPLNPDDDSDGVPTSIEVMWNGVAGYTAGLDLNPALSDTDGDGVGDLVEIAAGSNPLSGASANTIEISGVAISAGQATISWNIYSNINSVDVRHSIQVSTNLLGWTTVGSVLSSGDVNAATNLTDTSSLTNLMQMFYRVELSID